MQRLVERVFVERLLVCGPRAAYVLVLAVWTEAGHSEPEAKREGEGERKKEREREIESGKHR